MHKKVQCMKYKTIQFAFTFVLLFTFSGALQKAVCGEPADFECEVFRLVNDERAVQGLPELAWNDLLFDAARGHSVDMAAHDTLSHTGSDGRQLSDRISTAGYEFRASAENVAYNYADPSAVMAGWMGSPGHRGNILNENLCELGVGLAYSDTNEPYWTQNFGMPVSACPEVTGNNPCDEVTGTDVEADASTNTGIDEPGESSGDSGGCFLTSVTMAVP